MLVFIMEHYCIFPMCGSASRMGHIPKFLLPLPNKNTLLKNNISNINNKYKIIILITPDYAKCVYNYLKHFFETNDFQIIIKETLTMSETILSIKYETNKIYSMIMPDTYFEENNILDNMVDIYNNNVCDIFLGVFKIRKEQKGKLGQVLFDENNNLIDVIDKDVNCNYEWAWGTILWNEKFVKYLNKETSHIGYGLMPALNNSLKIKVYKSNCNYYDCGTFSEYKELLNTFE
jgi:hypothetical protein